MPNTARGSSGSLTRTISRNIRLISANEVTQTTTNSRTSRIGSKGFGTPAITEPTRIRNIPAITALIVPEMLKPAISSNFLIGVTK